MRDPRCVYCGVVTIFDRPEGKASPPNLATIDHLRPRHHPGRREPIKPGEVRHVLSCWKCNNDRDKRELREKPKEWFYENGGARPMAAKSLEELQWIALKLEFDLAHPGKRTRRNRKRIVESLEHLKAEIFSREQENGHQVPALQPDNT